LLQIAAARGLRTALYSRPGYAGSTPQPGRSVADAAEDIRALLDRLEAALDRGSALTRWLEQEAPKLAAVTGGEIAAAFGGLVSEVDVAALTGEFAEYIATCFRRALSTGIAGWRDDDLAFTHAWGFDVKRIERPVSVWQGGQDRMVPFAHGQWLAEHIPGARAHLDPREGHLSLAAGALEQIVDELLELAH
jgi:pimeloyl-ACP methyl ester carboxylesterase